MRAVPSIVYKLYDHHGVSAVQREWSLMAENGGGVYRQGGYRTTAGREVIYGWGGEGREEGRWGGEEEVVGRGGRR